MTAACAEEETTPAIRPRWAASLLAASAVGGAASFYSTVETYAMHREELVGFSMCTVSSWMDCAAAHTSHHAYFLRVPLGWIGFCYYVWCGIVALIGLLGARVRQKTLTAIWVASLPALACSVYMAGVLAFAIRSLCVICVSVYLTNIVITVLAARALKSTGSHRTESAWHRFRTSLGERLRPALVPYLMSLLLLIGSGMAGARHWSREVLSDLDIQLMDAVGRFYRSPVHELPLPPDLPGWGTPGAPIQIVLFSDFQCPICAGVKGILDGYEPHVEVVFLNYPLDPAFNPAVDYSGHPSAGVAALGGVLAHEMGEFRRYYEDLFRNQRLIDRKFVLWWLERQGVPADDIPAALESESSRATVERDLRLASEWGVRGTPTLFINGRRMDLFSKRLLDLVLKQEVAGIATPPE